MEVKSILLQSTRIKIKFEKIKFSNIENMQVIYVM